MTASSAITASNFSGAVTYSISPGLPAGLSFNPATGVISGTPTAAQSAASYTITATSGAQSATATVSIEVVAAVVGNPPTVGFANAFGGSWGSVAAHEEYGFFTDATSVTVNFQGVDYPAALDQATEGWHVTIPAGIATGSWPMKATAIGPGGSVSKTVNYTIN